MDVVDAEGRSVRGEVGELVCRKPFPGMTRGFWRDRERYLDTYWRRLPGIWVHGDWASVDEDGYWFLHGRSDDTLNIAGKRVGPAELESAVVAHPAVAEAAAVGVPHAVKGEVAWVFCALVPGVEPSEELAAELRAAAAGELGKAFAPERVLFVSALPKTRSAKIVRRAVRAKALGSDPGDLSSLENPETLEEIERVATIDRLDGQIALVTGGGRGIGAEHRAESSPQPAHVSRWRHERAPRSTQVADEIGGLALELDVTDREAVERTVAEVERELGPIDLLGRERRHRATRAARRGRPIRRRGGACSR